MRDGWLCPRTVPLGLPADEVHVWLVSLDSAGEELARFERVLEAEEHASAARYRFPRDQARFVARRGLLRQILACYLDDDPGALRFSASAHGKPRLDRHGDADLLTFTESRIIG